MKKFRLRVWAAGLVPAVAAVTLIGAGIAYAFDSGNNPGGTGPNTITWTGQGASHGVLDETDCDEDPLGDDQPYLHWIFTTDGGSITEDPAPVLNVDGIDYAESSPSDNGEGGAHHFFTPYSTPDEDTLTAIASFTVVTTGGGKWNLVISHGCSGSVTDPASLQIVKFYDANANGIHDGGELEITGWQVTFDSTVAYTPVNVPVAPGEYTVEESTPVETNWIHTTPTSVSVTILDEENEIVEFGNVCLGAGGGRTLGFWSNKNGQALIIVPDYLTTLSGLNLRNANGTDFDPASKAALKSWLLAGTAVNMANMLSVQLAAMKLNVLNGNVSGDALIYGGTLGFLTINELMDDANTELGLHWNTTASGPARTYQEALKNALDGANNNLNFVQPTACPFSFAI